MKKRGRPKGPDIEKIKKLLFVLKQVDVIWVSQLARISKMRESTVRYYLNSYLRPFIEEVNPFDQEIRKFLKVRLVKLKRKDISIKDVLDSIKLREGFE